ncbi:hypothetical protein EV356DRAFT_375381 [Viridothelium virens]|uniref:Uncharacterized protein n=1 Tax=Viridothelium virens TaxID=1048519 RepID=A0A6A6GVN1_VIRVR|nr:hypothetical protein EV356DRAFT_375381 [Viridothelium virens]
MYPLRFTGMPDHRVLLLLGLLCIPTSVFLAPAFSPDTELGAPNNTTNLPSKSCTGVCDSTEGSSTSTISTTPLASAISLSSSLSSVSGTTSVSTGNGNFSISSDWTSLSSSSVSTNSGLLSASDTTSGSTGSVYIHNSWTSLSSPGISTDSGRSSISDTTSSSTGPLSSGLVSTTSTAPGSPTSTSFLSVSGVTSTSTDSFSTATPLSHNATLSSEIASSTITQNSTSALNSSDSSKTADLATSQSSSTCSKPTAGTNGEIPTTFECKQCDSSTDLNIWPNLDTYAAWRAADANDALAESLNWYNLAKWGVDNDCPLYAPDPSLEQDPNAPLPSNGNCTDKHVDALPNAQNYIQGIQLLWKSNETLQCAITEGPCQTLKCTDGLYPCNYLITNSFVNYVGVLKSQYNALQQAQTEVQSRISDFASNFAPVLEDHTLSIIQDVLDGFTFTYGMLMAIGWKKLMNSMPLLGDEEAEDSAKDALNSIIISGAGTAKDQASQVANELKNVDSLTALSWNLTSKLMDTIETHVLEIQNGSLSSNQALNATLYNGTFLSFTSATSTMEDMREAAVQTIISQLIVPAWSLVADATGIGNIHPTIM